MLLLPLQRRSRLHLKHNEIFKAWQIQAVFSFRLSRAGIEVLHKISKIHDKAAGWKPRQAGRFLHQSAGSIPGLLYICPLYPHRLCLIRVVDSLQIRTVSIECLLPGLSCLFYKYAGL